MKECLLPCKIKTNCSFYLRNLCPYYTLDDNFERPKYYHNKQANHYRQNKLKKKYLSKW